MSSLKRILNKFDIKPFTFNPPLLLALLLFFLIILGTLLLKLPFSTERPISWTDAFFFSTSASTVTGLAPFDMNETFTLFGEIVLMVLIQVGGIGVMSFAVFFIILLGKRISMKQRQLMQEALNQPSIGGVIRLVLWLFGFSISIELVGCVFLAARFVPEFGWIKGLYYSLFHAISAFNQAGFTMFPDSLGSYVGDPIINLTITLLITLGGIGFSVLADLWSSRRFSDLALHSKVMLVGTLIIDTVAISAIFLIECSNPHTLGPLPLGDKILAAWFQGISPRTAGFSTVDTGELSHATLLLSMALMFIGGGSTSTSGGIKLSTFILIVAEVIAFLKGKKEVVLMKRTISQQIIARAMAITFISVFVVFLALLLLSLTEDLPFLDLTHEVVSAFGTAGASTGVTSHLTDFGKFVIICVMFFGKIGPLTLAFSFARRSPANIRYPDGEIYTG
ncbi:Ktr system potassium transporter B [Sporolactobacillus sp. THM7-7]|nr:Ktr system potassium transporter B [Sporolactobacillus sp. THM7-7]